MEEQPLDLGIRLERYRIDALLGQGGMGRVYRAYDLLLHRPVALKLLRKEEGGAEDARSSARLLREARAAAALNHPNVVSVFDVGQADGATYIVMEILEGKPLREYMGDAAVSLATKVRWLAAIARALAAAHARGLVHRDIKPDNVVVCADGAVKVLDFGIAKQVERLPDVYDLTLAQPRELDADGQSTVDGGTAGTPRFMSPEQYLGGRVDARTDQYSWGLVAYELLAGVHPWATMPDGTMHDAICVTMPKPLGEVASTPPWLDSLVWRALSKEADARHASMDDIVEALEGEPADQAPPLLRQPAEAQPKEGDATPKDAPPVDRRADRGAHAARASRSRVLVLLAVAVVVAASVAVVRSRAGRAAPATAPTAAASAPPAPTAMTAAPPPRAATPEAATAYAAALSALRGAAHTTAADAFERATELDPHLAAAHLRLYTWLPFVETVDAPQRLKQAADDRGLLSERDQGILDVALSDSPETHAARATALAARYPLDAEIQLLAAGDHPTQDALDKVLALDPGFALVWYQKARLYDDDADTKAALGALQHCVDLAPTAMSCLRYRAAFESFGGQCAALEADARKLLRLDGGNPRSYRFLAWALEAQGAPDLAVRTVFEERWAATPEDDRVATTERDELALSVLAGDFAGAERHALACQAANDAADIRTRMDPVYALVSLYTEMGETGRAAETADKFVRALRAFGDGNADPLTNAYDHTLSLVDAAARGNLRTKGQRDALRATWLSARAAAGDPPGVLWVHAYADLVRTPAEAKAALAVLHDYQPLPPPGAVDMSGLGEGITFLLGGRVDDALPYLSAQVASCSGVQYPFEHVRASLFLGQALEQKGDIAGACAAYSAVLSQWGAATKSVSAAAARARSVALGCDAGR